MPSQPPSKTLPTMKKRSEFLATAKGGRSPRRGFVLQAAESGREPHVGYTVTKKTGNAVERNRIKRRLRAAIRAASENARAGTDYVLIGRRGALSQEFTSLVSDLADCLAKPRLTPDPSHRHRRGPKPRPNKAKSPTVPKNQG